MLFKLFFFFNDTATTEIYTLSLHDALPILFNSQGKTIGFDEFCRKFNRLRIHLADPRHQLSRRPLLQHRSEEHTSELQSPCNLVCRLLLEKKQIGGAVMSSTADGSATLRVS